jgi:hypothetical protein
VIAATNKVQIKHSIGCEDAVKNLRVDVARHALANCSGSLSALTKTRARELLAAAEGATSGSTGPSEPNPPDLAQAAQPGAASSVGRAFSQEEVAKWEAAVASLIYENGLPTTITSTSQWTDMIAVLVGRDVAQRELKISRSALRGRLLTDLEVRVDDLVVNHFERNVMEGCATLITDTVTDEHGRATCNTGVYVPRTLAGLRWTMAARGRDSDRVPPPPPSRPPSSRARSVDGAGT